MDILYVTLKADRRVVVETLCRIGVANTKQRVLYPSCYLFDLDGRTALVHFKQLFQLSGRNNSYDNISQEDLRRRNAIAFNMRNWGLLDCEEAAIADRSSRVFVLPHKEKSSWRITHKYNVGAQRGEANEQRS